MIDFRRIDRSIYPELKRYSDSEIYDRFIGCGGLYLATNMVRQMNLKKGDIVLDLGCGLGSTSIFLTKTFDVTVIAVDLWFSPSALLQRIKADDYTNQIIPLNLDITQAMPFAGNYFDAIFCMNSLFLYGDNVDFLKKLIGTLKPGGVFCVGSECFNKEQTWDNETEIPKEFNFSWNWDVWESCFSKYHSTQWWKERLNGTDLLDIKYCEELADAYALYEDLALNYYQYFSEDILSMGAMIPQERIVDQILYGRVNEVRPSLYVLAGVKR